jgi:hypothetical protein
MLCLSSMSESFPVKQATTVRQPTIIVSPQIFIVQQAISVFRQAKTGRQFGHATRELSDLDFMW